MTNDIGDKRFESPADSRWDREVHAAKGLVVQSQWSDLEKHCDVTKFKEMALIGPDIGTHLSESNSPVTIHINSVWFVDPNGVAIKIQ